MNIIKSIILLLISIFYVITIKAQIEFVESNILNHVIYLKAANKTYVGIVIVKDELNYIITAKHLFHDSLENHFVYFEIYLDKQWIKTCGRLYFHNYNKIDIAVIYIPFILIERIFFNIKPDIALIYDAGYF